MDRTAVDMLPEQHPDWLATTPAADWLICLILIAATALLALRHRWLTIPAGTVALGLGLATAWGLGWRGLLVLCVFLLMGGLATRSGRNRKRELRLEEAGSGRRSVESVLAKGTVPAMAAMAGMLTPWQGLGVAFYGAVAAASFDTVATEIGQWLGRNPWSLRTLRPVRPGTPGAISISGTCAGLAAASVIALASWGTGGLPDSEPWLVLLSGTIGGMGESVAAPSLQRLPKRHFLMNLLTTSTGALAAASLWWLCFGVR